MSADAINSFSVNTGYSDVHCKGKKEEEDKAKLPANIFVGGACMADNSVQNTNLTKQQKDVSIFC